MIEVQDWGIIEYENAEKKQLEIFESNIQKKILNEKCNNVLALLEHDHVYTLGKNADESNILPIARMSGASFHHVSRGGDVTYHGPGQLVAYPIVDIQEFKMGVRAYVTALEEIGIDICAHYGIKAEASSEEGVWIDLGTPFARKIMAIGIKVSRYITMHGIAFNVNTNLDYFTFIVPCGIANKGVTSLEKELGREVDISEVKGLFEKCFKERFI